MGEAQRLNRENAELISQMSKQAKSSDLAQKEMAITKLKDQLTKKETEIQQILEKAEKEKQQLLGETETIAAQKAQEIAKKQFESYKKQTDTATALTIKTIGDTPKSRWSKHKSRRKGRFRTALRIFFKLCAELDAAISNLVLAQMEHMSADQIKDVTVQIARLKK